MVALLMVNVALRLGLLIAGVWAYRRLRLPSIPWIVGYLLLVVLLELPGRAAAGLVMDGALSSGLGPIGSSFTLGGFAASTSLVASALAAVGQALVAWFVIAELAYAHQPSLPVKAVPAFIFFPRQHSRIVGPALLASAVTMPLFWLSLLAFQA